MLNSEAILILSSSSKRFRLTAVMQSGSLRPNADILTLHIAHQHQSAILFFMHTAFFNVSTILNKFGLSLPTKTNILYSHKTPLFSQNYWVSENQRHRKTIRADKVKLSLVQSGKSSRFELQQPVGVCEGCGEVMFGGQWDK